MGRSEPKLPLTESSDIDVKVITPAGPISSSRIDMVPTFSGRFSIDGTPYHGGPVFPDVLSSAEGALAKDEHTIDFHLSLRGLPVGAYIALLEINVGSAPCSASYRYALGKITVVR
jgi:hypothetical protein